MKRRVKIGKPLFLSKKFSKQMLFVYKYIFYVNIINMAFIGYAIEHCNSDIIKNINLKLYEILIMYLLVINWKWYKKLKYTAKFLFYKIVSIIGGIGVYVALILIGLFENLSLSLGFSAGIIIYTLFLFKINARPPNKSEARIFYIFKR